MGNYRENYVRAKAKMTNDAFKAIHKKNYSFDSSRVFNKSTLGLFKNLKKDYIQLYEIILNDFLKSKSIKTEMEKLIWTSEFLEILNNNHDKILEESRFGF